jgi:hypothetical protein
MASNVLCAARQAAQGNRMARGQTAWCREDELAAIDTHIAVHGVRRYSPRYAEPTSAYLPVALAAARLAEMQVQALAGYAELLHRLCRCGAVGAEGRQEKAR